MLCLNARTFFFFINLQASMIRQALLKMLDQALHFRDMWDSITTGSVLESTRAPVSLVSTDAQTG